jgi:hypothetical protein
MKNDVIFGALVDFSRSRNVGDLGRDVLTCLADQHTRHNNWATVFFAYDHLAAFRTKALIQVPWDPYVFQYGNDKS